jgi:TrmH family RNA methyltransferase
LPLSGPRKDLVVLADLQDPGNTGAIWRTAAATGMGLLVCGDRGADPYAPKSIRAAAGAPFVLPAQRRPLDEAYLEELRELGYQLVGAAGEGKVRYDVTHWEDPVALLIGQEGPGLPDSWLDLCQETVRIPMASGVESLNASVSASLLLLELARSRNFSTLSPMSSGT